MKWFFLLVVVNTFGYSFSQDNYVCVDIDKYYFCNTSGVIITDGSGDNNVIVQRLGTTTCDPPCASTETCCRRPSFACGVHNPDGLDDTPTDSANAANLGEFPWYVDIFENGVQKCGGSIIHPKVVLTAAHCIKKREAYMVRAGVWNNSNADEFLKHQDIQVSTKIVHKDFYPSIPSNDIALLFLQRSFIYDIHIKAICLPPANVGRITERCYVTGRGVDNRNQTTSVPKKIDVFLVGKNSCETSLRRRLNDSNFYLHKSSLCARGGRENDVCYGDAGGPLVCPINGTSGIYQQIGIVSWRKGCFTSSPQVYTNVPFLRNWIEEQIKNQQLSF